MGFGQFAAHSGKVCGRQNKHRLWGKSFETRSYKKGKKNAENAAQFCRSSCTTPTATCLLDQIVRIGVVDPCYDHGPSSFMIWQMAMHDQRTDDTIEVYLCDDATSQIHSKMILKNKIRRVARACHGWMGEVCFHIILLINDKSSQIACAFERTLKCANPTKVSSQSPFLVQSSTSSCNCTTSPWLQSERQTKNNKLRGTTRAVMHLQQPRT